MTSSHRQIFKSSAIIGGASAINIVIGIVKLKVLAVLLGPSGVGLMGIYQNIMNVASTIAGCGIGTSGVRQLAASTEETSTLATVRRALWLSNLALGLAGMLALWCVREPVARWLLGDPTRANEIAWLGLGVFLTLIAASQTALLQGLRRIGDLAQVTIFSAFFGATAGCLMVLSVGQSGVAGFVIAAPAASVIVASFYVARLPRATAAHDWGALFQKWKILLHVGIPLMVGVLLTLATQLAARMLILRELGLDASGHFQAAWTISMTYIGFVLGSMGADFFPRLSAIANDHDKARMLVNEQTEMALLLAGPALIAMSAFSPWIIHLLYAESFKPAVDVLRWQVLGDIFKVASWPAGFVFSALGRGGLVIAVGVSWHVTYLLGLAVGLSDFGLVTTGAVYFFAYLVLFITATSVAGHLIGFRPARRNLVMMTVLLLVCGVVVYLFTRSDVWAFGFGSVALVAASFYSVHRLDVLMDLRGWAKSKIGVKR